MVSLPFIELGFPDIYRFLQPKECELRVFLAAKGVAEGASSPYLEVVRKLTKRHEERHLRTFDTVSNLSGLSSKDRELQTVKAVAEGAPLIYKPRLRVSTEFDGLPCDVVGEPDFLIREGSSYVIRESKMARRVTETAHPELFRELELYGWLFAQNFGTPALRLEVHAGTDAIVQIPDDGGVKALALLLRIVKYQRLEAEPYSPVGWSKCGSCSYQERCWSAASARADVAVVAEIDQALARGLRDAGTTTYVQLASEWNVETLAQFQRPVGQKLQRVGTRAAAIMRNAEAMVAGREIWFGTPTFPSATNWVMFDLEGLPPQLDELDKIFVWGMQVFGQRPSEYLASTPGAGVEGDKAAWHDFLVKAESILTDYGDIPFVHWHHYERVHLDTYILRFGDPKGIAARVRANLLDVLPVVEKCVALPLPSYSLKVVEQHVGFKRSQTEYGGDWAMAKYIESLEVADAGGASGLLQDVLTYNREDLAAMWAVFSWARASASTHAPPK